MNPMLLKKGDKLLCIRGVNNAFKKQPKTGKVYTFSAYYSESDQTPTGTIFLKELQSDWNMCRFVLATPLLEALC
jgi:hypothetical protein